MLLKCIICGKKSSSGETISHSHHATKRRFKANLQKVKINLYGKIQKALVCTRCLRSGKVQKVL